MYTARFQKHELNFIQPGGTSRGVMYQRTSWFILISDEINTGVGECAPLPGLSRDNPEKMESILKEICDKINELNFLNFEGIDDFPSIQFGLETAYLDLIAKGSRILFNNYFSRSESGIPINGLIWMGNKDYMRIQILQKIESGFDCIKLKISSSNIEDEFVVLNEIRNKFGESIEIRVDANGAFDKETCKSVLDKLAKLHVHSIEQPIQSGQIEAITELCRNSPIPIALDEDIIQRDTSIDKSELLGWIKPQYIVLKPGLIGGFKETDKWIELANKMKIGWWITSALESNIGLNALAQYTAQKNLKMKQGLGTGGVFSNNLLSPLLTRNGCLFYDSNLQWNLKILKL